MKTLQELSEGEKYIKGLHQAKVGDYISIGFSGNRNRSITKIEKVLDTDKLVDIGGNIFGRNGVILRRISGWAKQDKSKIVSAKIVTQKEFDKEYRDIKIQHIQNHIGDEDIETLEKIIDLMKVKQANTKNLSRFD
jgi:hypothetical protein